MTKTEKVFDIIGKVFFAVVSAFILFFAGYVNGTKNVISITPEYGEDMIPARACGYMLMKCINEDEECDDIIANVKAKGKK